MAPPGEFVIFRGILFMVTPTTTKHIFNRFVCALLSFIFHFDERAVKSGAYQLVLWYK